VASVPRGAMWLMVSAMAREESIGLKAHQGNMRGDKKDRGSKGDADRGFEMMALTAQHPGDQRTQQKAGGGQTGGRRKAAKDVR